MNFSIFYSPKKVTDEEFEKDCVRCGRILNTDTMVCDI